MTCATSAHMASTPVQKERSTFAHCSRLEQLRFPQRLRRTGQEAFLCSSLREVRTPPALIYIAHRAFLGCTQLSRLVKMEGKATWRGLYVERDTFELCDQLHKPGWINLPPPDQGSSRTFNAEEFDFFAQVEALCVPRGTSHLD